jgi:hypothetical protein
MKLSEFLQRIKLQVPNIGQSGVKDDYLTTLLNTGADETNLLTKSYKGYTDFNIEANKANYSAALVAPNYLGADKRGLFLKNSAGKWKKITSKTEAYINTTYPDYLNATSVAMPNFCWLEGDDIGFYPAPSTAYTLGCRLYHLKKSNPMTSGDHYPFSGSTTEIVALRPLDSAIIAYCRWKLSPAFGTVTDVDLREREFLNEARKGAMQIRRRPDLSQSQENGIQI